MKKMKWSLLALSGAMVAGCMSLEERLQSNDPEIKRQAEIELVQTSRGTQRTDAIQRLTDEQVIASVAISATGASVQDGILAVKKLKNEKLLADVAIQAQSQDVAKKAVEEIKDQSQLLTVGLNAKSIDLLDVILDRCDQNGAIKIASEHQDINTREKAIDKITDQKIKSELKAQVDALIAIQIQAEAKKQLAKITPYLDVSERTRTNKSNPTVLQIISEMRDKESLLNLQAQCCNWRSYKNYEPRKNLYDNHVVVDRLIELSPCQQQLADLIDRDLNWSGSGQPSGLGIKEYVLAKITDNALLLALATKVKDKQFRKEVYDRVTDEKTLVKIAITVENDHWQAYMSEAGANAVKKINDPADLAKIALLAKNGYIALEAKQKISADDFIKGFVALLKEGKMTDKKAISIVDGLKDNQGTIEMYDAAKTGMVKDSVFAKLKTSDRALIRARNKGECEKKIAAAKVKGKDTFELGGFYLGMDIADVDMLIGYYFPEWSNNQDFEDDEKEVRAIWVPNQKTAFCRAGKDGKVYELNFGKTILKKWYKYDVQRFTDWADKYAAENKINMSAVLVKRDVTVREPMSPRSYEIWYRQQSHQYKNNVKGYRLTYFTEDANYFSGHGGVAGNVLKGLAADRVRYIRGDAGMLKVRIERD